MTTFPICDVARGEAREALEPDAAIRALLAKPVEAFGCDAKHLVSCDTMHALAKAARDAFYLHHPLVLRPTTCGSASCRAWRTTSHRIPRTCNRASSRTKARRRWWWTSPTSCSASPTRGPRRSRRSPRRSATTWAVSHRWWARASPPPRPPRWRPST